MEKIFITGGAGYVGCVLSELLIKKGYSVTVFDLMLYGSNNIKKNINLKLIEGDIRNQDLLKDSIKSHDIVIHLACISNDPSFELNPKLGKSINFDAFEPLVRISKDLNIKRFIYASSSSVYGIKEEDNVNETMSLEPLTDYSIFKAECEKILLKYQSSKFITTVIRPATVCGYSPRQRLDVIVNIFTNLAFHNRDISIFGGNQLRPNININDMAQSYLHILQQPINKIDGKIFNVGFENQSVEEIAKLVKKIVGEDVTLNKIPTDDNRSYHISSEKIKKELDFKPKFTIENAIEDLLSAFNNKKLINTLNNENYYNIKKMQNINLS